MTDVKTFHEQVKAGEMDAVRSAVADDPTLLGARNEAGQTAILLAKYYGREEVADYLLSLNPELDIFTAAAAGRTVVVLDELDRDPALLGAHSSDGWTPLHLAAYFGHAALAEALLARGAGLDAVSTNAMKNTPLHAATAGRRQALVELLLNAGADANARQSGGWTALHAAAQNGDRGILELLLAHGADIRARADNQQGALDLALMKGRQEAAGLLQELGAGLQ